MTVCTPVFNTLLRLTAEDGASAATLEDMLEDALNRGALLQLLPTVLPPPSEMVTLRHQLSSCPGLSHPPALLIDCFHQVGRVSSIVKISRGLWLDTQLPTVDAAGAAGVEPDEDTFALLMHAHAAAGDMQEAEEVMDHMRDAGAI